jgi:PhnB protein
MSTTIKSAGPAEAMELKPFIYLYGRAEEALEYFKHVLDGTYAILIRNQAGGSSRLDPSFIGKVSYAEFSALGIAFAISDGGGPKTIDPDQGNIILSLRVPSADRAAEIFHGLSQGGVVVVPFKDADWGGKFGNVRDRFGNEWFVLA